MMGISLRRAAGALLHRFLGPPLVRKLLRALFPVGYTIRPADPARDLDSLASFGNTLRPFASARWARRAAFRRELAELDPEQRVLLVAADECGRHSKVLGFVRAVCHQGQDEKKEWWIVGLEVRPLYWRRGIGEALSRDVVGTLRQAGVERIYLSVRKTNMPAIELYHKLGFEKEQQLAGRVEGDDTLRMILGMAGFGEPPAGSMAVLSEGSAR
jgi:ribosomal protein S18 acetylase RimI-like enzyme